MRCFWQGADTHVVAGLHDPRVGYWEPAKYVAKLREYKTDSNMLLLKCEMGAGRPCFQLIAADCYSETLHHCDEFSPACHLQE